MARPAYEWSRSVDEAAVKTQEKNKSRDEREVGGRVVETAAGTERRGAAGDLMAEREIDNNVHGGSGLMLLLLLLLLVPFPSLELLSHMVEGKGREDEWMRKGKEEREERKRGKRKREERKR